MTDHSPLDLTHSWLAADTPERLLYWPKPERFALPFALALVLGFCATVAYPKRSTAKSYVEDQLLRGAVERARGSGWGRLLPELPSARREPASAAVRLAYRSLAFALGLAACISLATPFRHKIEFRRHHDAKTLVIHSRGALGSQRFEVPLSADARIVLQACPRFQRFVRRASEPPPAFVWTLSLAPSHLLPQVDAALQPSAQATAQPPPKASRLADGLAEMTGWPIEIRPAEVEAP